MEAKNITGATRKRKQKIYYGHYQNYRGGNFYPVIRVGGIFLRQFGFDISDNILVDVTMGKIIISKMPKDYSPP